MLCPYCDNEMKQGLIDSQHEINWKSKRHLFGNAELHKSSILLSEYSFLKGSAVIAYLCRSCEKIIIDYKDRTCDLNRK